MTGQTWRETYIHIIGFRNEELKLGEEKRKRHTHTQGRHVKWKSSYSEIVSCSLILPALGRLRGNQFQYA